MFVRLILVGILLIEVFIHSRSTYMDVDSIRHALSHVYCSPETGLRAVELFSSKLAGVLPEKDVKILQEALKTSERTGEKLKVFDVSRIGHRIRAMKLRIRKTPTIIVNGEKNVGFEKSRQTLRSI